MTSIGSSPSDRKRAVEAGAIGNFVEWYHFIIYGALAVVVAPLLFPAGNPVVSLLATLVLIVALIATLLAAETVGLALRDGERTPVTELGALVGGGRATA